MKYIFIVLVLLSAVSASATTRTAASCQPGAIQTAINKSAEGDTILVLNGTPQTWVAGITVTKGITINFQNCLVTLSGGITMVAANCTRSCSTLNLLNANIAGTGNGFHIDGYWPNKWRVGGWTVNALNGKVYEINPGTWYKAGSRNNPGLIDHLTVTNGTSTSIGNCHGSSGTYDSWLSPAPLGTANALYIEDSTVSYPTSGSNSDIVDADTGCSVVVRHNTFFNTAVLGHDASNGQKRGQRSEEIYDNVFGADNTGAPFDPLSLRGGTGVFFNNDIPIHGVGHTDGWETGWFTEIQRLTATAVPYNFLAGQNSWKVCSDMRSHCSGGTHNACGMDSTPPYACSSEGTGTCQNACTVDADCGKGFQCVNVDGSGGGGYMVRDQTSAGTDAATTHIQSVDPFYLWNNTNGANPPYANHGGAQLDASHVGIGPGNAPYIQANREFYVYTASFNGSTGMGMGSLVPTNASAYTNAPNCTTGVGYWNTTNSTLYKCTSTNSWTTRYTPYTYPHPLQGGAPR